MAQFAPRPPSNTGRIDIIDFFAPMLAYKKKTYNSILFGCETIDTVTFNITENLHFRISIVRTFISLPLSTIK